MKLGMEVDLSPGHIVLDGAPAPPKRAHPEFSTHVCCGVAKRLDGLSCHLPLGMEVGLDPDDIVLDGDSAARS